jgi:hypothetical protein
MGVFTSLTFVTWAECAVSNSTGDALPSFYNCWLSIWVGWSMLEVFSSSTSDTSVFVDSLVNLTFGTASDLGTAINFVSIAFDDFSFSSLWVVDNLVAWCNFFTVNHIGGSTDFAACGASSASIIFDEESSLAREDLLSDTDHSALLDIRSASFTGRIQVLIGVTNGLSVELRTALLGSWGSRKG